MTLRSVLLIALVAAGCRYPDVDDLWDLGPPDSGDPTDTSDPTDTGDDTGEPDCDPDIPSTTHVYYIDRDGDGFGQTGGTTERGCEVPEGFAEVDGDCNDNDDTVYPGAPEVPDDGIDQSCNGFDTVSCRPDADGDGFGALGAVSLNPLGACASGFVPGDQGGDCDDTNQHIKPDGEDRCDGYVNDCDDWVDTDDDGRPIPPALRDAEADLDGDGYVECVFPDGVSASNWGSVQTPPVIGDNDCDDGEITVFPNAPELCDGLANRCGEPLPENEKDNDNDGYVVCVFAEGEWAVDNDVIAGGDCNDANARVNPGAAEMCDGLDTDCNPATGEAGLVSREVGSDPLNPSNWTDVTSAFTEATTTTLGTAGTYRVCEGTYATRLDITTGGVTVVGLQGPEFTTFTGSGERRNVTRNTAGTTTLQGLTFVDGYTSGGSDGGAMRLEGGGTVNITSCSIEGAEARNGGAIYITGGSTTVNLHDTEILDAVARTSGGAIYVNAGTLGITESLIDNNEATTSGGGVFVNDGNVTITDSTLSRNQALGSNNSNGGGGLHAASGTDSLTLDTVTFDRNHSATSGGGLRVNGGVNTVDDCTFVLNTATTSGGGARLDGGTTTFTDSNFSQNSSGSAGGLRIDTNNTQISGGTFFKNESTTSNGGGAIRSSAGGTNTITGTRFEENTATFNGGAIALTGNSSQTLNLIEAHFEDNSAVSGGAVYMTSNTKTLDATDTDFINNVATGASTDGGGAIASSTQGAITLLGGTLQGNKADAGHGGAILVALSSNTGNVTATGTTFQSNSALRGGAILLSGGTTTFTCVRDTAASTGALVSNNALETNTDPTGSTFVAGGIELFSGTSSAISTGCAWNNFIPNANSGDVGFHNGRANYGGQATFTCVRTGGDAINCPPP